MRMHPERTNVMKKFTAALLLVLAVSTLSVFATEKGDKESDSFFSDTKSPTTFSGSDSSVTLDLATAVNGLNYIAITDKEFTGTTVEEWNQFNAKQLDKAVTVDEGPLAFINLINNKRTGVAVYFKAKKMQSVDNASNTYTIDYKVNVNNKTFDTNSDSQNILFVSANESAAPKSIFMESYPVSAALDTVSYDNAPEDNYVGIVTFTFSAS